MTVTQRDPRATVVDPARDRAQPDQVMRFGPVPAGIAPRAAGQRGSALPVVAWAIATLAAASPLTIVLADEFVRLYD